MDIGEIIFFAACVFAIKVYFNHKQQERHEAMKRLTMQQIETTITLAASLEGLQVDVAKLDAIKWRMDRTMEQLQEHGRKVDEINELAKITHIVVDDQAETGLQIDDFLAKKTGVH